MKSRPLHSIYRLLCLQYLLLDALAIPQAQDASSSPLTSAAISISTGVPSITLITSIASPTVPLTNTLPTEAPLPPVQPWCPSQIFCAGELLQAVNIAELWMDPKTFVDKPTNASSQQVLSIFDNLVVQAGNSTSNLTEGQVLNFVDTNFRGEGLELEALALTNFNPSPAFLQNVTDPLIRAFAQTVHGFWTQLIRGTNSSTLCGEGTNSGSCESTLIPLNHTFVIPGGRFREQYYWDSYWIVQGLIQSELLDIANSTLQNFMDEIEDFGFIPNGGRIYYLDRSQPPLFIHMLSDYVQASNDTGILARALPLAETELLWWQNNRTLNVTSPYSNQTYAVSRYDVNNSAPRPESYITDYLTANDPTLQTPLNESEKADLYAELATGAESGWDYTVRFVKNPYAGGSNNTNPVLRTLNIRSIIPVDLNSILYNAHILLADLYSAPFSSSQNTSASSRAVFHRSQAATLRSAILDLFWDSEKLAFYDFNLTSNARNSIFTAATFYPYWVNIIPNEVLQNETAAFGAFSSLNFVLNRFNGTFPSSYIGSGLQWDFPNSWPPHQFIAISALRNLPANISTTSVPSTQSGQTSFDLIPNGQLGLSESDISGQPLLSGGNATAVDINTLNGTVIYGGNATSGETWTQTLQRELVNRYVTSVLCSWSATGGSIPGVLPRLSDAELNVTQSINNTGNMFEKFSILDLDSAGSGGEYTVQAGFGWTNGILLWAASNFGSILVGPECPPLLLQVNSTASSSGSNSSAATRLSSSSIVTISVVAGAIAFLLPF